MSIPTSDLLARQFLLVADWMILPLELGDYGAKDWVSSMDLNVQGTLRPTLPKIIKTRDGGKIALPRSLAETRIPEESAHSISKHAANRLTEWVDIDERPPPRV